MNYQLSKTKIQVLGLLLFAIFIATFFPAGINAQEADNNLKNATIEKVGELSSDSSLIETATQTASEAIKAVKEVSATEAAAIENIKKVIEKNISTDKVKETFSQVFKKKRGIVGQISRVTEEMITLSVSNSNLIIKTTSQTTVSDQKKELSVEDLAVGDWVSVLGFADEDQFDPIEIKILKNNPFPEKNITTIGNISSIKGKDITVTSRKDQEIIAFFVNDDTIIEDVTGKNIELKTLQEDITCIVVAQEQKKGNYIRHLRLLIDTTQTSEQNLGQELDQE